jgi:hypothetical protein
MTIAFGLLWSVSDARAICGRPPSAQVTPYPRAKAPRNARVFLDLGSQWRTPWCATTNEPRDRCEGSAFDLRLRPAAAHAPDVAIELREQASPDGTYVDLVPRAPLDANQRYEVWRVDRAGNLSSRIVGTFVTTAAIDTTPPAWRGVTRATFAGAAPPRAGVITVRSECDVDSDIAIDAPPASDDQAAWHAVRYAVWIADAKGAIAYDAPPFAREAPDAYRVIADAPPASIRIAIAVPAWHEPETQGARPRGKRRIGVRAVDLAGNASAPSEIDVDFGK